jgi:hypothetical protein
MESILLAMGPRGSFTIEICHFEFIVVRKSTGQPQLKNNPVSPAQLVVFSYIKMGAFVRR